MNFDPSEEQRLFAASIERFVARDYGFDARRRIVASPEGYSREAWKILADLGLIGLAIPALVIAANVLALLVKLG